MKKNEQLNIMIEKILRGKMNISEFYAYIKKNYEFVVDAVFDPIVLELSNSEANYNLFVKNLLKIDYLEYTKIINTNKDKLQTYFNDCPGVVNDQNELYKDELQKLILNKINNIKDGKNAVWYANFILYKHAKDYNLDVSIKVVDSLEMLTYVSKGFDWASKLNLVHTENAYLECGVIDYDYELKKEIIYINLTKLMDEKHSNITNLYFIMQTCFHELEHAKESKFMFSKENYINTKEGEVAKHDRDFYNEKHNYFNFEIAANMGGLVNTNRELFDFQINNLIDDMSHVENYIYKEVVKNMLSPVRETISTYTDKLIESNPDMVHDGVLSLEYNWNGKRRTMQQYFDILFTHSFYKEFDLANAKKNNPLAYELINYITYNIIKQYPVEEFINQYQIFASNNKEAFIIDAINQAKEDIAEKAMKLKYLDYASFEYVEARENLGAQEQQIEQYLNVINRNTKNK